MILISMLFDLNKAPTQLQLWKILCQLCRSFGLQEHGAVRPKP